ncbi:MAG: hypothetical protein U9O82_06010, partial [Thermodesulfobacteriota bacterium]|nr:hypothetical protein [Thermodesulfobacteriota bacterium]
KNSSLSGLRGEQISRNRSQALHLNAPNGSALGVRSARLTYYLYSEPNCQRPYGAPENDYILKESAKYGAPLNGYNIAV